jgi:hypothetical protein
VNTATKSLLDPTFIYRNAANTDVRITFERVRREQEALRECDGAKVVPIVGRSGGTPWSSTERPTLATALSPL